MYLATHGNLILLHSLKYLRFFLKLINRLNVPLLPSSSSVPSAGAGRQCRWHYIPPLMFLEGRAHHIKVTKLVLLSLSLSLFLQHACVGNLDATIWARARVSIWPLKCGNRQLVELGKEMQ